MARSFFSRKQSKPDANDLPADVTIASEPVPQPEETLAGFVAPWREQLVEFAREDAQVVAAHTLVLSDVHPGGVAQLYSDNPTLLANLVREPSALSQASSTLRNVQEFAAELRVKHGDVTTHLAIGSASWYGVEAPIPVLMRKIAITTLDDGELSVRLLPGVEVNSRLMTELADAHAPLDQQELMDALRGPQGFSPASALAIIRDAARALPDFELTDRLAIGIFTHPTGVLYRELGGIQTLASSPVLRALAGDEDSLGFLQTPPPEPNPRDRDPWKEMGLGDQSPAQQDLIERLAEGASLVLEPQSGADVAGTIVSIAGGLAEVGKHSLIVLNDTDLWGEIESRFEKFGVDQIVASFHGDQTSSEVVAEKLSDALSDASPAEDATDLEEMRLSLRRAREALSSYTEQLHERFPQWGVSAFDALQVLTDLTSLSEGPSTRVRLDEATLTLLTSDSGQQARRFLQEASNLGIFTAEASDSPWRGVVFNNQDQAEDVLAALERLVHEFLPAVRVQMSTAGAQTGLATANTLQEWREQLGLLGRVRQVLDTFRPEVFERSPADLVVATAPAEWRKQRSINLKGSRRRQLVKQAKDLVRPGVHIEDLHASLIEVQSCRYAWVNASADEGWPMIPDRLDNYLEMLAVTDEHIDVISHYLEPIYGELQTLSLDELARVLESLEATPNDARLIPERVRVLGGLDGLGLRNLVDDLRARLVDGDLLGLELDLSWWASALGFMLAAEPRLGGFDPAALQKTLAESRTLDEAQVRSLGPQVVERVRRRRREALAFYPDQYTDLAAALTEKAPTAPLFGKFSLSWDMLPIVLSGPTHVPQLVRWGRKIDTVIVVGMGDLPFGEIVPMIARGPQTVVVARDASDLQSKWIEEVSTVMSRATIEADPVAVDARIASLILEHKPDAPVVATPTPKPFGSVDFIKVTGFGMSVPQVGGVESSAAEVDAVVDYLVNFLAQNTEETIAVASLSQRHAARVRAALERRALADPNLSVRVQEKGGAAELVVSPATLQQKRADRVVLSVGFTKTPYGRVIHEFGELSTPDGIELLEQVAKGVRNDLTIISSLEERDFDRARLHHPGERVLVDLIALAQNASNSEDDSWPTIDEAPDELLVDLADRLHGLGLNVVANLGVAGGIRIPLAIGHPEVPGELLVAILTDDQRYVNQESLRVRDRHWVKLLEHLGWKVRTELSMSVFIDPNHEANEIVNLVLDAVDEYYERMGLPHTPASAKALAEKHARRHGVKNGESIEGDAGLDSGIAERESESTGDWEAFGEDSEADAAPRGEGEEQEGHSPDHEDGWGGLSAEETALVGESRNDYAPSSSYSKPIVAQGLPLTAYSDDLLDEISRWIRNDEVERTEDEEVEALRDALGMTRRGAQSDAILRAVIRRTAESD